MQEKHRFRRAAMVLATLIALAGCVSGPPLPTYGDAFKGLYNQSSATVPADVAIRIQHPVAIILSDNVELYIDWLKRTDEAIHRAIPDSLINTVGEADANPNYISAQFLDMLKRHFPEAQVVRDFNCRHRRGQESRGPSRHPGGGGRNDRRQDDGRRDALFLRRADESGLESVGSRRRNHTVPRDHGDGPALDRRGGQANGCQDRGAGSLTPEEPR